MRKGFTLIELLAVIVILAIVLAIAISAVIGIIDNSKINAYKNNVAALIRMSKVYLLNNSDRFPINVGDTTEITLDNLKETRLLSPMKSPYDNSKECVGYILVTKLGENNYDYSPNLNCTTNISSNTEDALTALYKFDDFQEPTQNLITNFSSVIDIWGTPIPTGTSTYFASPTGSTGVNTHIVYNGAGGVRYGGSNYINVLGSTQYTVSAVVKWEGTSTPSANLLYLRQYRLDNSQISELGLYSPTKLISLGNSWYKAYNTFTTAADATKIIFQNYQYSTIDIWVYDFQLEQKKYLTPFVSGARIGIIKDYTINNKDILLGINNTPQWITGGKNSVGGYSFDGIDDYIDLPTASLSLNNTNFTIAGWFKPDLQAKYQFLWFKRRPNAYITPALNSFGFELEDTEGLKALTVSTPITNKWYFLVQVYQDNMHKVYVYDDQGLLGKAERSDIDSLVSSDGSNFKISSGGWWGGGQDSTYKGTADNIRIYKRALSEQEINNIYSIEK